MWSPDGRAAGIRIRQLRPSGRLSIVAADGTGAAQELPCPGASLSCEPTDWSPDGRHLIVNTRRATTGTHGDVWSVSLEAGGSAEAILGGAVSRVRRADITGRSVARLRFRGDWPGRGVRSGDVGPAEAISWSPTTVAANLSGAAMDARSSTSILKAVFVDDPLDRRRANTRRCRVAERTAHRIGTLGHAVRRVAGRSTRVLHRPDAAAEAERHQRRDRLAGLSPVAARPAGRRRYVWQ